MTQNKANETTTAPDHQSMNSKVQSWCNELEMRITESLKYVDFLFAYQRTNGKDLSRSLEAISNRVNADTERVTTWLDICSKHACEKTGSIKY